MTMDGLRVPEGMTAELLRDLASVLSGEWHWMANLLHRWADDLAAQIGDKCSECGRAARGDEFAMSRLCQRCLNPTLAAQIDARPPTGAERYLSERMKDDDYAASYIAADARPPAPSAPEVPEVNPMDVREFAVKIADYVATNINADGMSKRGWAIEAVVQAMEEPTASDEARAILGVARPEPVVNAPAPESSPDGEEGCVHAIAWRDGQARIEWLEARIEEADAERTKLRHRLAAWPEVPDGHELLVVPSEVVDEYAAGDWDTISGHHVATAARAAVDRRPKPEPQRVPWCDAQGRRHASGSTIVEVGCDLNGPWIRVTEDGMRLYSLIEHGTVEVLAEDGES